MATRKTAERVDELEARVAALEDARTLSWMDRPAGLATIAGFFALLASDIATTGVVG